MRVLGAKDVAALLRGQEEAVLAAVELAYRRHEEGATVLPHSVFVRPPGQSLNRIIALPAWVGGELGMAGIKWISSFPGNVERGFNRASAVIVLTSTETGLPLALLEGSLVSAHRTAASAAAAARLLHARRQVDRLALVGGGAIQLEILRYLRHGFRLDGEVVLFDNGPEGGARFAAVVERLFGLRVGLASSAAQALAGADVLSLATTAAKPHLDSLERLRPGATVLHVSLRDLAPEVILGSDNVVDDRDHVLRAETSLHLAEQAVGNRAFIRASLGELLLGRQPVRPEPERLTVFSPFGLGVLDLAVADWVYRCAEQAGLGRTVEDFQPRPWWEVEA